MGCYIRSTNFFKKFSFTVRMSSLIRPLLTTAVKRTLAPTTARVMSTLNADHVKENTDSMKAEECILIDYQDKPIGQASKLECHVITRLYYGGNWDKRFGEHEITHVCLARLPITDKDLNLRRAEVKDHKWLTIPEMKKFVRYTDETMTLHFMDISRLIGYDWLSYDGDLHPYIDGTIHYGSCLEVPFIR